MSHDPQSASVPTDGVPAPHGAATRRGPFRPGDRVQLTDEKMRLATITLTPGGGYHTHRGVLQHDDILGLPEGSRVTNSEGFAYLAMRPLLSDFVLSMPRGAAVVYPKDAAQIVTMADIYPGARVVEAGVGSGALTLSLLRAVGDGGHVHSIERREEFADVARGNITTFFGGEHPSWRLSIGDFQDRVVELEAPRSVDRVVLDMLAPWECTDAVATVLAPGGVWINYVATATQLSRTAEAIREDGRFTNPVSWESMVRGWHVEGLAVRPDHRMVAHTGFLLVTRRLSDGASPMYPAKRSSKSDFSPADVETWTPEREWGNEELGERGVSSKKLRRAAKDAASMVQRGSLPATDPDAVGEHRLPRGGASE
ncbi:tRNA (adenine-N1)-methyltransferase [Falsarthrobacter nasiphocae]|uniref:tRNA (Adenine57-N1/adenine58-N1)-methyltransferase n=1 Tax=Falsarthrobacter nasiphocae TaxID=189863 RepID=A0AAE3YF93_9MICC|nr:tRNA (adenine-N1)-methyltransferase [Falsarthrobacter nasiphocae]MDR6891110.1 tRNA (adenine57-N1/adenine58-N1)-methyltransferase [Falsarthrobacter nasiphocae]